MTSIYEAVEAHHRVHGDDFGNPNSRIVRYDAALSLFPRTYSSLLDVGCGSGRFRLWWNGSGPYTGIDLVKGTNVLDYEVEHDLVIGLGVLYRVPPQEQWRLIKHMWGLARTALVVQTITPEGRQPNPREWPTETGSLLGWALALTPKVALRADYMIGDCAVALYR